RFSHWILGIIQRPRISVRNSSTNRSCSLGSSLARFALSFSKNSRFRLVWLSRPKRTSAAMALLMLISTVSAYCSTWLATVDERPTVYLATGLLRRLDLALGGAPCRP